MKLPQTKSLGMHLPRMNPATVLVDPTFVEALVDPTSSRHEAASAMYRRLVEQYRSERVLLVATAPSLHLVPRETRRSLLAPVTAVHVAQRYRWAARRITAMDTTDVEFTTLLVLLRREKIHRIATFDPRFAATDVDVEQVPTTAATSGDGGDDQSNAA